LPRVRIEACVKHGDTHGHRPDAAVLKPAVRACCCTQLRRPEHAARNDGARRPRHLGAWTAEFECLRGIAPLRGRLRGPRKKSQAQAAAKAHDAGQHLADEKLGEKGMLAPKRMVA